MYDEYKAGKSQEALAKDYGVTQQRVSQLFKRAGLAVRPAHRPKKKQ